MESQPNLPSRRAQAFNNTMAIGHFKAVGRTVEPLKDGSFCGRARQRNWKGQFIFVADSESEMEDFARRIKEGYKMMSREYVEMIRKDNLEFDVDTWDFMQKNKDAFGRVDWTDYEDYFDKKIAERRNA